MFVISLWLVMFFVAGWDSFGDDWVFWGLVFAGIFSSRLAACCLGGWL
jgi:hypothetical protein